MRNLLIIFIAVIATIVIAGSPESVTVGTNSVVILCNRDYKPAAWVGNTNAYAVGQYVRNANKNYIVTVAGTATNGAPTHGSGVVAYDGVSYRFVPRSKRKSALIVNDSTNVMYLAEEGYDAVANAGIRLNASGGAIVYDSSYQGEVRGVATADSSNATVMDR